MKFNQKPEEVTTKEFSNYTGLFPFQVLAVNPNLTELKDLGVNFKDEPVYIRKDKNEKEFSLITFWLKSRGKGEIVTSVTFMIYKDVFVSSTEKTQFINSLGRTCWAENKETTESYKWFNSDVVMESHRGLDGLCSFLYHWGNMGQGDTVIEQKDIDNVISGKTSFLKTLVKQAKDYTVKCLLGVRLTETDNGAKYYQTVYNKFFGKHSSSEQYVREFVEKNDFNAFSTEDYPIIFTYTPKKFIQSDESQSVNEKIGAQTTEDETDDLPF